MIFRRQAEADRATGDHRDGDDQQRDKAGSAGGDAVADQRVIIGSSKTERRVI